MNLSWLLPEIKGIPVLMYHRVWPDMANSLTITPEKLQEQWDWLKAEGYSTLSLSQFLDIATGKLSNYPERSLLITFDDGYLNNLTYVYPLLQQLDWQATFFIIGGTLDGTYPLGEGVDEKMTPVHLRTLDPNVIQLAMHGYQHEHFKQISNAEIKNVLETSIKIFERSGLPFYKSLAYPYGARPKGSNMEQLKEAMPQLGITSAFRIGNQVSRVPVPDIYEIRRIDICGTDSMDDFKVKLKKGKLKPF